MTDIINVLKIVKRRIERLNGFGEETEVIDNVISLLKAQEAVSVVQREVMHMLVWCCGSCGVAITDGDKFYRMCGRAVKWDA